VAIIDPLLAMIGLAGLTVAAGYSILTVLALLVWQRRGTLPASQPLPPISILKPLCGAEPGLYENLKTFCQQDYPEYQIVFGVLDPRDPALAVVRRLMTEFPSLPIDVVINPQQHGSNCKVSNLINIMAAAWHDVLAMADSDCSVGPDYLRIVTTPLRDRAVGLVSCLYRAVPTQLIYSRLGAMYVNEWYMPSVLLAWLFGYRRYVSGQTLCIRRETLHAIGGLQAIASHLADDHRLGELVTKLGLRIVLSPYMPSAECHEPTFGSLSRHEVRWMRTIHVLRPRCFPFVFLSFSLPLAVMGIMLAGGAPSIATPAWALFATVVGARLALYLAHRFHHDRNMLRDLWLLPVRDLLLFWVWYRSLSASRITWRGNEFDVDAVGVMHRPS
jgi:ceramide glucosyltransferase